MPQDLGKTLSYGRKLDIDSIAVLDLWGIIDSNSNRSVKMQNARPWSTALSPFRLLNKASKELAKSNNIPHDTLKVSPDTFITRAEISQLGL